MFEWSQKHKLLENGLEILHSILAHKIFDIFEDYFIEIESVNGCRSEHRIQSPNFHFIIAPKYKPKS